MSNYAMDLPTLIPGFVSKGNRRALKDACRRALKAQMGCGIGARLQLMRAEVALSHGDHKTVVEAARALRDRHSPYGHYYLAQSLYLRGELDACERLVQKYLQGVPKHPDASYLLAETSVLLGKRESAWNILEEIGCASRRLKTWLVMSNLVQKSEDFERLLSNVQQAREKGLAPVFHRDLNEYLANGALRCGNYKAAREIWRDILLTIAESRNGFSGFKTRRANYSSSRAETALGDLRRVLSEAGIPMFLVSGTLLGCIREGKLLGHDKDIDVGIWEDVPRDVLLSTLRSCGLFYVLTSRVPEIIRIKHVNGIAADVFYHFREEKSYWHGGVKVRWHNSPFDLVERKFLGENYLIPGDHEKYLTENYGDWRIPKKEFDSAYDTPNAEVLDENELAIHAFKMLLARLIVNDEGRISLYLTRLLSLGEESFVESLGCKINLKVD